MRLFKTVPALVTTDSASSTQQLRLSPEVAGYSWAQELSVFGLLFLIALFIRLPFFFRAVLDWDESTFVLMGQSILDGHLPYTELWEIKPPLAFVFYALAIALFGKNLVAIRLAGTLCVVEVAFLVYVTATRLWDRRVGFVAATLSIVAVSLLESGQATMTEHVALVPLMGALYLMVRKEASAGVLFVVGILTAMAVMIRLSAAYVAVILGFYLIASAFRSSADAMRRVIAYAAGGTFIVGITFVPYLLAGQQRAWWTAVVSASLAYSDSQYSIARKFGHRITACVQGALGWHSEQV